MTFQQFKQQDPLPLLEKLGANPQRKGTTLKCRAVWRGDEKPSVEWTCKNGSWLWHDRTTGAGGDGGSVIEYVAKVEALDPKNDLGKINESLHKGFEIPLEAKGGTAAKNSNIVRSHIYHDDKGNPVIRKTKFKDGNWNTQHHDGTSWQKGAGDKTKIPLYRENSLSDVSSRVWLCEGEKDADSLAALNESSVASWDKNLSQANLDKLKGRSIIIASDADTAGEKYAEEWFDALIELCPDLKIIRWPEDTAKGFDVSDFLGEGSVSELLELAISADEYRPLELPESLLIDNDTQRAELFAGLFGETTRFVPERGSWLNWRNGRWNWNDALAFQKAMKLGHEIQKRAAQETDPDSRQSKLRKALTAGDRKSIENQLALAKSLPKINTPQSSIDGHDWKLACQNGVIDLRAPIARCFAEPCPGLLLTKCLGTSYDPKATCPTWEQFLQDVFEGDDELIEFIKSAVGYSLTSDTREQCLFFLHGGGSNGKSTFTETLQKLFGSYGQRAPKSLFERSANGSESTNDLARLDGIRFVIGSETEEGSSLAESKIKDLTGGDTITARYLHKEFFDFAPSHKLWMFGNHQPRIKGADQGIWRRIRLIPFNRQFTDEQKDRTLPHKLEMELSGILNWALQGCQQWQEKGLPIPSSVAKATADYRDQEDVIGQFLTDRLNVSGDPEDKILISRVYEFYRGWCEDEGLTRPLTNRALAKKLRERGFESFKSNGAHYWRGVIEWAEQSTELISK